MKEPKKNSRRPATAGENLSRTRSQRQIGTARIARTTRKLRAPGGSASTPESDARPEVATLLVHFELNDPSAREVYLAGTFNDWKPASTPMLALAGGKWVKDLILGPGTYEYRFVVDGKWLPDPARPHTVPNPFGEANSVVIVGVVSPETAGRRL